MEMKAALVFPEWKQTKITGWPGGFPKVPSSSQTLILPLIAQQGILHIVLY